MSRKIAIVTFLSISTIWFSCKQKQQENEVKETRTSGTTTILVDEAYASLVERQLAVFKSDYPDATVKVILGNENEILPQFTSGEVKMLVMSRMLKPNEKQFYENRKSPVYTDRFAIDGIALITNKKNTDSTITVEMAYDIMRGTSNSKNKLVFDNAYSSTIRYFIDSAGITKLPEKGVYTLKTPNDVIKFVAENDNYIGVVGVNWLLKNQKQASFHLASVKTLGVRNQLVKDTTGLYYKPTQENLINGKYPFLRNVYILNAEGTGGLGTGFANWLASPRGQLIVLKSGLAPHEVALREFNFKN